MADLRESINNEIRESNVNWGARPVRTGKTIESMYPRITIHSTNIAPSVDLRSQMPPVLNQLNLNANITTNACVSIAVTNAILHYYSSRGLTPPFVVSFLFIYYNARVLEHGSIRYAECPRGDCGSTIDHTVTAINTYGICSASTWPNDLAAVNIRPLTADAAYIEGAQYPQFRFVKLVFDLDVFRSVLYYLRVPILFGFIVYDSYSSAFTVATGYIVDPLPDDTCGGKPLPPDRSCNKGHACLLTSYDDVSRRFGLQNSYGLSWGDAGYGTISYEYVMNYALASWDDVWIVLPSRAVAI